MRVRAAQSLGVYDPGWMPGWESLETSRDRVISLKTENAETPVQRRPAGLRVPLSRNTAQI